MAERDKLYMGIDIGSVSLNIAIIDEQVNLLNFDGSCRMSQYALSFKLVLKRLGLSHIPVVAPSQSIRLDETTRLLGLNFARAVWRGWLATDVLLRRKIYHCTLLLCPKVLG